MKNLSKNITLNMVLNEEGEIDPVINIAFFEVKGLNAIPNVLGTVFKRSNSLPISKGITIIFVNTNIITVNLNKKSDK